MSTCIGDTREVRIFLEGVIQVLCVWGIANKRESRAYDPVYDLRSKNTTKNTLNITFLGEGV